MKKIWWSCEHFEFNIIIANLQLIHRLNREFTVVKLCLVRIHCENFVFWLHCDFSISFKFTLNKTCFYCIHESFSISIRICDEFSISAFRKLYTFFFLTDLLWVNYHKITLNSFCISCFCFEFMLKTCWNNAKRIYYCPNYRFDFNLTLAFIWPQ